MAAISHMLRIRVGLLAQCGAMPLPFASVAVHMYSSFRDFFLGPLLGVYNMRLNTPK